MRQINAPKPPAWRDPACVRAEARSRRRRPILLLLSCAVLSLLALPQNGAYDEAISYQLARGAPSAWALFVAIGANLGYVAFRLWHWENRLGSIAAGLVIVGLGIIAVTDPFSSTHNTVFVTMSAFVLLGHVGLFYGHLDLRLLPTSLGALVAVLLCFSHLGLGERLLIASSLIGLNVLVYGYLDV